MNLIFNKIKDSFGNQMPFVVYRKPNITKVCGFFQENKELYVSKNFEESGFIFAPFKKEDKVILIPEDKSEFVENEVPSNFVFSFSNNFTSDKSFQKTYVNLIEKAVDCINNTSLEKVVISREELLKKENFDLIEVFAKLLQKYSNAFVYIWYHPKVGLWFGATPETLLSIVGKSFKTMSLAGTQVFKDNEEIVWKAKELEEQLLVTNFIKSQLEPIASNLLIDPKETIQAGNLLHLKTKVTGVLSDVVSLKELIEALHPTPAVCGLPREMAKSFIQNNENYNREFYTGFLGELNLVNKNQSSLFVNLRCMQVVNNFVKIYLGGGITKDSDSLKEWQETVFKSETIKSVL